MIRLLLAFVLSATAALTAVVVMGMLYSFFVPGSPWGAALHFGVPAALVIYPITFVVGFPLYCAARLLKAISWGRVILGGVFLALVYPVVVLIDSDFSAGSVTGFVICGGIGALAGLVFCQVAGIKRARD